MNNLYLIEYIFCSQGGAVINALGYLKDVVV